MNLKRLKDMSKRQLTKIVRNQSTSPRTLAYTKYWLKRKVLK